jgi:hypothetical protein
MTKPKAEAVALEAARVLSVKNPPNDDWCSFARDVGAKLFELGNARNGFPFDAHYLALGILDAQARQEAELDAQELAEDEPEREARALRAQNRERLRELIRLVTVDGKPVKS